MRFGQSGATASRRRAVRLCSQDYEGVVLEMQLEIEGEADEMRRVLNTAQYPLPLAPGFRRLILTQTGKQAGSTYLDQQWLLLLLLHLHPP